jgi:hypothetical protein
MSIVSRAELLTVLGTSEGAISAADSSLLNLVHPLAEASLAAFMQTDMQTAQRVEFLPASQAESEADNLDDVRKQGTYAVVGAGGSGGSALQLKHTPVILTGLQVWEDENANANQFTGAFGSSTLLTAGVDYWLDTDCLSNPADPTSGISTSGLLYRSGSWPTIARSVKISYYGGFTSAQLSNNIAGAIKLSAIETIIAAYKTLKQSQGAGIGGKASETIGKYSYTATPAGALTTSMAIAVPFSVRERMQPFRVYSY